MPSSAPSNLLTRDLLRPTQRYVVEELKRRENVLLVLPMSAGKTVATLTALRDLFDEFMIRRALIVAPLRVATETWPAEIERWEHTRVLSYSVLTGSPSERAAAARRPADIHIINRENLPWLWEFCGGTWPYDVLVWDESSSLKGGKKRTAKGRLSRFGAACQARPHIERVIELTGTPAPNGLRDLWGQIYLLDQGERLGRRRTAFEQRWFESDYMGYTLTPREGAEAEIMSRISDIMLAVEPDQDEIETVYSTTFVDLPPKVLKEYRRFERECVSLLYDVEAVSAGVLTNKLLQFANGILYRPTGEYNPANNKPIMEAVEVHDEKLKALADIVEEASGENILVAYSFKADLEKIRKRFSHAVCMLDEPEFVKKWNAGKIKMGLVHPASAGHGLNLQFGGHILVWYGLNWSLELYQQLNMRLPRPGQKNIVAIRHIVARDTVDEDVMEAMRVKGATQDSITAAVQRRIERLA